MADGVIRRPSAGWWLNLAALALAVAAGCSSTGSQPARVVEAKPASAARPAANGSLQSPGSTPDSKGTAATAELRSMDLREGAPEVYLDVEASAPLVWTSFRNAEGKVVVELPNAQPGPKMLSIAPDEGLVASVKVEKELEGSRPMTRLIIATRHEVEHSVSASGSSLQVRLLPVEEQGKPAAAAGTGAASPAPSAARTPVETAQMAPPPAQPAAVQPNPSVVTTKPKMAFEPVDGGAGKAAPPSTPASTPTSTPTSPISPSAGAATAPSSSGVPLGSAGTPDQPAMGTPPSGAAATRLESVEVISADERGTVVRIAGDGELPYSSFALEAPSRFVIDLQGVVNKSPRAAYAVETGVVQRVRVAQFHPPPKAVARVVFDLKQGTVPSIERAGQTLVVRFPTGSATSAETGSPGIAGTPAAAPPRAAVAPASPSYQASKAAETPSPASHATTAMTSAADAPSAPEAVKSSRKSKKTTVKVTQGGATSTTASAGAGGSMSGTAAGGGATSDLALRPAASGSSSASPVAARRSAVEVEEAPAAPAAGPGGKAGAGGLPRVAEAGRALPPPADLGLRQAGASGPSAGAGTGAVKVGPFTPGEGSVSSVTGTEETFVGEPIDLKVTNADVNEVLRTFAQISGLNIVIQPGVNGTVTAELENVPWDQALYEVLKINNLGYELSGNVMRIAPTNVLRQEATERQQLAQARALAIPLKTIMRRLSYANAQSVANLLRSGSAGLLSQRGSVIVDDRTNTLIIKELPTFLDTVLAVVENLDTPEPQVIIEARIIETTKRFTRNLGVTWGFDALADAAHGNTTGLVFPNNGTLSGKVGLPAAANNGSLNLHLGNVLNTFTLDLALQAAESEGLINILSAPKIATLNNELASIQSGVQIPVQTVANGTISVQYINATLRLDVTPQVTAEGTILMDITITKREPQFAFLVPGSTNAPIATKDAHTRLVVRDGGTAVIGGIYQITSDNGENRVPGLGKLPIVGHLFKNTAQREENDELLIFITPRVIKL